MIPLGIVAARYSKDLTVINSGAGTIPASIVLGVSALLLARRARERAIWTLGRSGGETTARIGKWLSVIGLCMAVTASLSVGFYGLLTLFAS